MIGDGAKRIDLDKARLEPVDSVDLKDITPEKFPQFTQWLGLVNYVADYFMHEVEAFV